MTRVKIAITIPEELLAQVREAVERGEARSVSSYISDAVARRNGKRPLEVLLDEMKAEDGTPAPEDYEWADEQLRRVGFPSRGRVRPASRSTQAR